jgi:hypothetical protein
MQQCQDGVGCARLPLLPPELPLDQVLRAPKRELRAIQLLPAAGRCRHLGAGWRRASGTTTVRLTWVKCHGLDSCARNSRRRRRQREQVRRPDQLDAGRL